MKKKSFFLWVLISIIISIVGLGINYDVFAHEHLNISDFHVKKFLLDQKIDLESIWEDAFYFQLTPEDETYLYGEDRSLDKIPEMTLKRYEKYLNNVAQKISKEIDLKVKNTFLGLDPKDEKEILKFLVTQYFSLDSFIHRISARDEYLLDVPSIPFYFEKLQRGFRVITYAHLSQSKDEFLKLEEKRFEKDIPESFIEKHKRAFQIALGAMMISSKVCDYLKNKTQVRTSQYSPNSQCPLPEDEEINNNGSKNIFLENEENKGMCPAETIKENEVDSIKFFSSDAGSKYFNFLERIKSLGIPLSLIKKYPYLEEKLRGTFPGFEKFLKTIYQEQYLDGLDLKEQEYNTIPEDDKESLKLFEHAIDSLKSHEGLVYHGVPENADYRKESYHVGDIVSSSTFISTSKSPSVAYDFLSNDRGIFFTIYGKNGKSISSFSSFPDENEFIFAPNTRFKVSATDKILAKELIKENFGHNKMITHVTLVELE